MDGSQLDGSVSPNTHTTDEPPLDPAALVERARLRGVSERDTSVHKAVSWATGKNCGIHVGISLEIADPVGEDSHEIRYWEHTKVLWPISSAHELYSCLVQQLPIRALPNDIPETGENTTVEVQRKEDGAYIRFTPDDNLAEDSEGMPTIAKTE
jgi:hypothetical protein